MKKTPRSHLMRPRTRFNNTMIWGILILRISVGCSHRKQNIFWERNHFETNDLNSDGKDHEQPEPVEWNSLISD